MGSKIDVMKGGDERILLPMFLLGTLVIVGIVLECERFSISFFHYRFSIFEPGTKHETNVFNRFQPFFRTLAVLSNTIYGLQHI